MLYFSQNQIFIKFMKIKENIILNIKIHFIIVSAIISTFILRIILPFLVLTDKDILEVKQQETKPMAINMKKQKLKNIKIKYIIFFVLNFLLLILFWYYLTCFYIKILKFILLKILLLVSLFLYFILLLLIYFLQLLECVQYILQIKNKSTFINSHKLFN